MSVEGDLRTAVNCPRKANVRETREGTGRVPVRRQARDEETRQRRAKSLLVGCQNHRSRPVQPEMEAVFIVRVESLSFVAG